MSLRVSVVQAQPRSSVEHCVSFLLELLENVALSYTDDTRPQLLVFAELFLGGYHNTGEYANCAVDVANDSMDSGSALARICEAAKQHNIALCFGYCEKVLVTSSPAGDSEAASTVLHNSALFVASDGSIVANARKTHLWGPVERQFFVPGDKLCPVFTYKGLRISILICFDVEFPETCRTLRKSGAQLILVPTALVSKFNALVTVPSRAAENSVFMVYANEIGSVCDSSTGAKFEYCGRSCIIGPDGEDLARCASLEDQRNEDEVRTACVNPLEAKYIESYARNPYLECLRPELYVSN
jgi:predicted amidohydrolase